MNTTSLPSLSFRVVATLQFIIMLHHKNCPVLLLTRRPSLQGEVMGGHDLTKSKHMLGAQTTAPGAAAAALPPAHSGQWAGCALPRLPTLHQLYPGFGAPCVRTSSLVDTRSVHPSL